MSKNNFSENERIDAFSKALALVLRRIAGKDDAKAKSMPANLAKPLKKKEELKKVKRI